MGKTPTCAPQIHFSAPHWHSREVIGHVHSMTLLALLPVVAISIVLFGLASLAVILLALVSALVCEKIISALSEREMGTSTWHTVVCATILALTLPPQCRLDVVVLGAVLMIAAREVFGGLGHYLWHPILVSRALLAFAFPQTMDPQSWSVLKRAHLIWGQLDSATPLASNVSWFAVGGDDAAQAWSVAHPLDLLSAVYEVPQVGKTATHRLLELIRDELPAVGDCLMGTTGGAIGETCTLVIIICGVLLLYRGYLPWTLPGGALLGAIVTASILPIPGEGSQLTWWPVRLHMPGQPALPLGLLWVCYHLWVGEFLFAVFFIASDMTASPLRARGHFWFGLGIGIMTIMIRFLGLGPGSTYWAILLMNTFVPLIDRATRRRVYGT